MFPVDITLWVVFRSFYCNMCPINCSNNPRKTISSCKFLFLVMQFLLSWPSYVRTLSRTHASNAPLEPKQSYSKMADYAACDAVILQENLMKKTRLKRKYDHSASIDGTNTSNNVSRCIVNNWQSCRYECSLTSNQLRYTSCSGIFGTSVLKNIMNTAQNTRFQCTPRTQTVLTYL